VPATPLELIEAEWPEIDVLVPVLDRYIRHGLRRSSSDADHELARAAISRLRMLGVQITETGAQPCASPVSRVLAYAQAKTGAMLEILKAESEALGDSIRAVVVTDYEKSSATKAATAGLSDAEAGGAIAAFRALLTDETTDALDPILVTGSTVLVDDDLLTRFMQEATTWLAAQNADVEMIASPRDGFYVLTGIGADWSPRLYVAMITDLLQRGITRCLVGTRGLLGEGWDAQAVNVLIDLTTVTTSMTVNQLRGRSIRLNPADPKKVADNWDIVCVAGEFTKGLDDYLRFIEKHRTLYGITDDGAVEKGVGHVHAAFTELEPEGVEGAMGLLNEEMLSRAKRRDDCRRLWKLGEPLATEATRAVELRPGGMPAAGFPPFKGAKSAWSEESLVEAIGRAVLGALREAELIPDDAKLRTNRRTGGYVRTFLEGCTHEAGTLFAESLHEALGPLDRPRYIVPRAIDVMQETWLSRIMPEIIARRLRKRRRQRAMLHAVPSALAKNKSLASIYERHWNEHVSPGSAMYALQGEGETLVEEARRDGWSARGQLHEKDVYV
jgi:hypothetical protein